MTTSDAPLCQAARYFPPVRGRYEVAAGLSRLGADLGNGAADGHMFQLDVQWARYHQVKLASRAEDYAKYVGRGRLPVEAQREAVRAIASRLATDHPQHFQISPRGATGCVLACALTGDELVFDSDMELAAVRYGASVEPCYGDALDALACQVQEDMAIDVVALDGSDELGWLHVCLPNHWAPAHKLGRPFAAVHEPVPDFERLARQSGALLKALVERGPFVRFAWGLATDTRLNHHPLPAADCPDPDTWRGRTFDPAAPQLYLRVERQVTQGLPQSRAFLFTIRTYFQDVAELSADQRETVAQAVESMGEAALRYKGLWERRAEILAFLRGAAPQ